MKTNTGKIARLPREVREELNRRLDDGDDGPTLLAWLNARPGTLKLMQDHFAGQPINKQNLSDWRQGGFLEWQRQQEAFDLAAHLLEDSGDVEKLAIAGPLADRLAHLVAISLGHLLQAAMRQPDSPAKTRAVLQSARELIRLRHSDREHERACREQQDWQRQQRDLEAQDREKADRQRKDRLLAPLTAERTRKIMALAYQSDGHTEEEAEEIARFRTAVEYDLPNSEWTPPPKPTPVVCPGPESGLSNLSSLVSTTEGLPAAFEVAAAETAEPNRIKSGQARSTPPALISSNGIKPGQGESSMPNPPLPSIRRKPRPEPHPD